jgi:hypothetical protein
MALRLLYLKNVQIFEKVLGSFFSPFKIIEQFLEWLLIHDKGL